MYRGRGRGRSGGNMQAGKRGHLGGRGRGSGRGRQASRRNDSDKRIFYSTRVEEARQQEPNEEDLSEAGSVVSTDVPALSGDSETDNELPSSIARPYNSLLLSLNSNRAYEEPERKKQKTEDSDVLRGPDMPIDDVDEEVEELADIEEPDDAPDEEEIDDSQDPFIKHISQEVPDLISKARDSFSPEDMRSTAMVRSVKQAGWSRHDRSLVKDNMVAIDASDRFKFDSFYLKERLKASSSTQIQLSDLVTKNVARSMFDYQDIYFPYRSLSNSGLLSKLACLHSLNHIFKTRDKVIKNNARLAKEGAGELEIRDQGFTRPKVLILLPTRNSCVRYVENIILLCNPEQQENKKRFQESYLSEEGAFSENKPDDFRDLFAGNDDDMFRLGLKFTRKSIKYFAQFYNSDIIFASPLGLRMALGADDSKKQDHDFLSSIEIVIMDQADAMLMQNWEHIEYIFEHINLQPKEAHGCDFSRVRHWYLDGHAKYFRQTILLSAFQFPALNKIFHRSVNLAGCVEYRQEQKGAIVDLGVPTKQTFSRVRFSSIPTEPDDRFTHFLNTVLPVLTKHSKQRTGQASLIFIPNYADFVRVRNHFANSSETENISFGSISEYTSVQEVARARSHFVSGRHSVLLYTERAHHFRRYHLKGVSRVVMYGLPENPTFYREIVGGFLYDSMTSSKFAAQEMSVKVLFSICDRHKLERIVGSKRCWDMLAKRETGRDTFEFS